MKNFLLNYYKKQKEKIILLFLFILIYELFIALIPAMLKKVIDSLVYESNSSSEVFTYIIIFAIITTTLGFVVPYFENNIINNTNKNIRVDLLEVMNKRIINTKNETSINSAQVVLQDVPYCQSFLISIIFRMCISFLTLLVIIILLISYNAQLGVLLIFSIPLYIGVYMLSNKLISKIQNGILKNRDQLAYTIDNIDSNSYILKHVNNYSDSHSFFYDYKMRVNNLYYWFRKKGKLDSSVQGILILFQTLIFVITVLYGRNLLNSGVISVGTYVAFLMFIFNFFSPIQQIIGLLMAFPVTTLSIKRVMDLMNSEIENEEKKSYKIIGQINSLEVNKINYNYESDKEVDYVLKDFIFHKGNLNFLDGLNGVGKTTLVKLINRYIDAGTSIIKFNDVSVNDIDLSWIRKKTRVLYQKSQMYSKDINKILEHIVSNKTFKNTKVNKFISEHQNIFEGKKYFDNLSGGEKQLFCFMEALAHSPQLLIIDEGFSNLDTETTLKCYEVLNDLKNDILIIIISHDLNFRKSYPYKSYYLNQIYDLEVKKS